MLYSFAAQKGGKTKPQFTWYLQRTLVPPASSFITAQSEEVPLGGPSQLPKVLPAKNIEPSGSTPTPINSSVVLVPP